MNGWRRIGTFLALAAATVGGAQPGLAQDRPDRLETRVQVLGAVFDNFFQSSVDTAQRTIHAGTAEGRLSVRPDRAVPLQLYVEGVYVRYEALGGSPEVGGGLRYTGRPHELRVRVGYQDDRPAFDLGEVVRTADISQALTTYSYRLGEDWETGAELQYARIQFDNVPANDTDLYSAGGSLRYRGWGYDLSPEVGVSVGRREAVDPDQEYGRHRLYARLVSVPVPGLYASVRYRYRSRGYTSSDPSHRNFDRSDEGSQWTVGAAYDLGERSSVNLYYNYQNIESTLPARTYTAQTLQLGASLRL